MSLSEREMDIFELVREAMALAERSRSKRGQEKHSLEQQAIAKLLSAVDRIDRGGLPSGD
jgi:hypothetical protein